MSQFVLIAGIGHCGTKWLAQLLDWQEQGVLFYHQYKYTMTAKSWDDWQEMQREHPLAFAEYLGPYCDHMRAQQAHYRIVGDAISWMPLGIPDVAKHLKIDRIVYLVRNGIPQINSIWHSSPFGRRPPDDWMFRVYMKYYWELMGKPCKGKWQKWTPWEKTCLWWATNAFMPEWLRVKLPKTKIDVCRLEDLTSDVEKLGALVKSFDLNIDSAELRQWQGRDINRKIHDSRDPLRVWQAWPKEWRAAFTAICGAGMRQLGYKIPS